MFVILATMYLLVLHTPGNNEVTLNAKRITSMRDGEHKGQYLTEEVGCMINTEDGKFTSVTESCEEVRRQITELEKQEEQ